MAFAESSDIAGIPDSAVSMPTHRLCKIAYLRITQPVTRQERSQFLRMRSQRGFRVYNGIQCELFRAIAMARAVVGRLERAVPFGC